MKRRLFFALTMLLLVSLALAGCGGKKTTLKMATGGTTGTYYAYSGTVSQVLSQRVPGLSFDLQATGASKANIYLIADNEADIAIVQNDVMYYAYHGTDLFAGEKVGGFSAMAGVYAEVCQVVAKGGITSIADLREKGFCGRCRFRCGIQCPPDPGGLWHDL